MSALFFLASSNWNVRLSNVYHAWFESPTFGRSQHCTHSALGWSLGFRVSEAGSVKFTLWTCLTQTRLIWNAWRIHPLPSGICQCNMKTFELTIRTREKNFSYWEHSKLCARRAKAQILFDSLIVPSRWLPGLNSTVSYRSIRFRFICFYLFNQNQISLSIYLSLFVHAAVLLAHELLGVQSDAGCSLASSLA